MTPLTPDDIDGLRRSGFSVHQFVFGREPRFYRKHDQLTFPCQWFHSEAEAWDACFNDAVENGIITPIGSRDSAQESDANN